MCEGDRLEYELISEYPVPARRLFELLCSPAFQEAMALRFGATEASAEETERCGDLLRMRIELREPGLDRVGRPGRGKPEGCVILHDWDLSALESHWSRHLLRHGKNLVLEGGLRVEPMGEEACRLVEHGLVESHVPLLGRSVERHIHDHIQQTQPHRVDFIMRRLGLEV